MLKSLLPQIESDRLLPRLLADGVLKIIIKDDGRTNFQTKKIRLEETWKRAMKNKMFGAATKSSELQDKCLQTNSIIDMAVILASKTSGRGSWRHRIRWRSVQSLFKVLPADVVDQNRVTYVVVRVTSPQ